MLFRMHHVATATATAFAAAAVIAAAGWAYETYSPEPSNPSISANSESSVAVSSSPLATPDAAAVARLVKALGQIDLELRYGSPELKALDVCYDISHGASEGKVHDNARSYFSQGGSIPLNDDQGIRIVAVVQENICPYTRK